MQSSGWSRFSSVPLLPARGLNGSMPSLISKHGLSPAVKSVPKLGRAEIAKAYRILVKRHGETCFVCGSKPKTRKLHVDHDHATGEVRGLLCYRCNRGLSWFSDNPALLWRAANYLEAPKRRFAIERYTKNGSLHFHSQPSKGCAICNP